MHFTRKLAHTEVEDGRILAGVVDLTGTGELVLASGTTTAGEVVGRTVTRTTGLVVVAVVTTRTSVVVVGGTGLGVVVVTGRTGASSAGTTPSPGIRPVLCLAIISFN